MNCKFVKMQLFLTVLFALPLCHNKRGQAAAAGQKSACGLRSHGSRVRPKNSNLIEKMSIQTVNLSKCNCFSPFFLRRRSVIINAVGRQRRGKNQPVG
jgi:hypothetical protein